LLLANQQDKNSAIVIAHHCGDYRLGVPANLSHESAVSSRSRQEGECGTVWALGDSVPLPFAGRLLDGRPLLTGLRVASGTTVKPYRVFEIIARAVFDFDVSEHSQDEITVYGCGSDRCK
jgi:hypothetical protein